MGEHLLSFI